jgi:hypothetical protein
VTQGLTWERPLTVILSERQTAMPSPDGFACWGGESKNPVAPGSIYLIDRSFPDVGSRGPGVLRLRLSGCAGKTSLRMTVFCHCEVAHPFGGMVVASPVIWSISDA